MQVRCYGQYLFVFVVLLVTGCVSANHRLRDFDQIGRFDSFVNGVSGARFSGHSVESGWYFRVCGQHFTSEEIKHENVHVLVENKGPAVWVDYLVGAALLDRGDSVVVYEGVLGDLVEPCEAHEWQWAVFKRDKPSQGSVNLLIIMRFEDDRVLVDQPILLDAWYSVVVRHG